MSRLVLTRPWAWPSVIARSPERAVVALIVAFLLFRVVSAATLGLGVDEAYGIGVSHDFKLSYFDHPPLSYWIVHVFIPLLGEGRALRLPFIALFVATTWTVYLFTRQLFGATAGFWAVLALNLSAFFTFAGAWILPDGPLMLSLAAAACTIAHGLFPTERPVSPWRTWLIAGFWIGLAGLSKYHVALFVVGLLGYLLSMPERRKLLLHPAPWAGALLALMMMMPVVVWNAEHHWVSLLYQGGRASSSSSVPKIGPFFADLGRQFLWLAPWVFVPMVTAGYLAFGQSRSNDRSWYCLCLGLPTILIFTLVPLWGDRQLAHWQMPGWLMLFPVLGDYLARAAALRRWPRIWAIWSAVTLVVVAVLFVGHAMTGYGRLVFPAVFAKGDPTLETLDWTPLREELQKRGLLDHKGLFVISGSPIDIGKIDQALEDSMPMLVFGVSKQYAFRYSPDSLLGRDALIMGDRRRMANVAQGLAPYFASIEELPPFAFGRSGMKEIEVQIFFGRDLRKPLPSPYDRGTD